MPTWHSTMPNQDRFERSTDHLRRQEEARIRRHQEDLAIEEATRAKAAVYGMYHE